MYKNKIIDKNRKGKIVSIVLALMSFATILLMSTISFAATDTSSIDGFITFACDWLKKIGGVVMLVGGVMFALGWQREDAEGKTRGLQTLMAGAMLVGIAVSPDIFGL